MKMNGFTALCCTKVVFWENPRPVYLSISWQTLQSLPVLPLSTLSEIVQSIYTLYPYPAGPEHKLWESKWCCPFIAVRGLEWSLGTEPQNITAWPFFQLAITQLADGSKSFHVLIPSGGWGSGSCVGLGIFFHHRPFLHLLISLALTPVCVQADPAPLHQLIGLEWIYRFEGNWQPTQ